MTNENSFSIIAKLKFIAYNSPSFIEEVEGELRFGNHPYKGGYNICFKTKQRRFNDDKFPVKEYDNEKFILDGGIIYDGNILAYADQIVFYQKTANSDNVPDWWDKIKWT